MRDAITIGSQGGWMEIEFEVIGPAENRKPHLMKSIQQHNEGKGTAHELIEEDE